jgi:hypothetical protein
MVPVKRISAQAQIEDQPGPSSHRAPGDTVNCALEFGIALRSVGFKPRQQFQIHFIHSGPFPDDSIAGVAFQNVILLPSA